MQNVKKLLGTTVGKLLVLAAVGAGAYEVSEMAHGAKPTELFTPPWVSSNSTQGKETTEIMVRNFYQTPSGRVILGDHEDYLDPQNKTVVVPASLAKSRNLDAGVVGKTIKASGMKGSYKGRPQLIAQDITIK
jgi:hypothetical protein